MQNALHRSHGALKKHLLNSDMIMEILEVPGAAGSTTSVQMNTGRGVGREGQSERVAQGGRLHKASDAGAAGGIRLEDIHCPRLEHAAEIGQIIAILASGNFHSGRDALTQEVQAFEILRGDWLLKPTNVKLREYLRLPEGFLARVGAISVDEQTRVSPIASRAARTRCRSWAQSRPIFIFTCRIPASTQRANCFWSWSIE